VCYQVKSQTTSRNNFTGEKILGLLGEDTVFISIEVCSFEMYFTFTSLRKVNTKICKDVDFENKFLLRPFNVIQTMHYIFTLADVLPLSQQCLNNQTYQTNTFSPGS